MTHPILLLLAGVVSLVWVAAANAALTDVAFQPVDPASKEAKVIASLYAKPIQIATRSFGKPPVILAAPVQLSNSDKPDLAVRIEGPAYCGSLGCKTDIIHFTPQGWVPLLTSTISVLQIADASTSGYRNLVLDKKVVWKFNPTHSRYMVSR